MPLCSFSPSLRRLHRKDMAVSTTKVPYTTLQRAPCHLLACKLCLFASIGLANADTLRIVSWDLKSVRPGTYATATAERELFAAETLLTQKPDVIVLHHVQDWSMASRVAQSLQQQDYRVLVCSSFPNASTHTNQVAIIARRKA